MTRIHLVALPHTLLTKQYDWCAYTAKLRRFVDMLDSRDISALVYGPDVHECSRAREYIPIVDGADRKEWFGAEEWDIREVFNHWDAGHIAWQTMNERAATEIRARWKPGDILGLIGGGCQKQILDQLADLAPLTTEWGIGYSGVLEGTHKVFESYAWAHHVAGFYHRDDIQFYDTVIPNTFDLDDFAPSTAPGDYLLYLGRPNPRKGLPIIEEIAKRSPIPVIIAGQAGPPIANTTYVGVVTGDSKAALLAGAHALLCPTTYLEPFGGVAVEAMLSGTPAISTDWGAFTETVMSGVSGYRCRTLLDFMHAIDDAAGLDRAVVRRYAESRYSTSIGADLYAAYLGRLETLYADGWYTGC